MCPLLGHSPDPVAKRQPPPISSNVCLHLSVEPSASKPLTFTLRFGEGRLAKHISRCEKIPGSCQARPLLCPEPEEGGLPSLLLDHPSLTPGLFHHTLAHNG